MNLSPIALALLLTALLTVGCQGKKAIDTPSAHSPAHPSGNPLANQPSPATLATDLTPAPTETSSSAASSAADPSANNQPTHPSANPRAVSLKKDK